MKLTSICPLLALLFALSSFAAPVDPLEEGFRNPPASAKPHTWWHWMNGNVSRDGITADLEAMKRVGIGGAQIFNVDSGIPHGPVQFMSPESRALFKHAIQEADRLGIEICLHNCAGWSSSGGPWNTAEFSMQKIVTSETRAVGPSLFSNILPKPEVNLSFYQDIAVLAFPATAEENTLMRETFPAVTTSGGDTNAAVIIDGNPATSITLPAVTPDGPPYAQLEFREPFAARSLMILPAPDSPRARGRIEVSDDGKTFRTMQSFTFGSRTPGKIFIPLGDEQPVSAKFWRITVTNGNRFALAEVELSARKTIERWETKAGYDGNEITQTTPPPAKPSLLRSVKPGEVLDLTSQLDRNGNLEWSVPPGKWIIVRIGHTPTGQKNHPAPPEGTGLECDKMSTKALDLHWEGFMQKILDDAGPLAGKSLNNALIDSYEVGGQNWTAKFREEFRKRRGYDLLRYLPVFTGRIIDNPQVTDRFLWDVRKTVAELMAENYFGHFARLCRKHGLLTSIEPYTGPFESLQCGAPADIVMGEFWSGSQGHRSVKIAASVAHIYGKQIVGAESFTARPDPGRWQNDPYSLKALGDLMYCQGLNRYIFHRYAHQPWMNRFPGMTMGQWGFHFERTITWWEQSKAWLDYITRCQFLLQQGRAVADVAYFCGENAPVELRANNPPPAEGYDYDGVNADVLNRASMKNGRLTLANGANYAVLVLPTNDPNMRPELLKRLHRLVRDGATVVGNPPEHSPSLEDFPASDVEVKSLADEIWGAREGTTQTQGEHAFGNGKVIWGRTLTTVLSALKLKPDFEFAGSSNDVRLAYVHRVAGKADLYFVSNQQNKPVTTDCTFRVDGRTPELWHPDTGLIETAPVWREVDGRTRVRLSLDPAGSVFVLFRQPATGDHVVAATATFPGSDSAGEPVWEPFVSGDGKSEVKAWTNGAVELKTAKNKLLKFKAENIPAPLEVTGEWDLNFPPNWDAPPLVKLEKLISWTDHANDGVRYFSGTAVYRKEIEVPAERLGVGRELWLDLGAVKNFAEVSFNGRSLGVLWKPPFRVNVTAIAKPGLNQLTVKVTNLWPNRLIGDEQLPADCEWEGKRLTSWPGWLLEGKPSPSGRLTFTTWHHWTKDATLLESGLLGPVTLRTAAIIPSW